MLRQLVKDAARNFVAASMILILAGALSYAEILSEQLGLPKYMVWGARTMSIFLLIVDGIVVCGTSVILAIRLLARQWRSYE